MAETKHTPGPWAVRCSNLDVRELEIYPVFDVDPEFGDWTEIARVRDAFGDKLEDGPHEYSKTAANAQLIAAAPKMLEALKDLVAPYAHLTTRQLEACAVRGNYGRVSPHIAASVLSARAVIAKAEGH